MNKGIGEYWIAQVINDDDIHCGHCHRSWDTAERCARQTIRAAKMAIAGKREHFAYDDEIARYDVDAAVGMVHRHTYSR